MDIDLSWLDLGMYTHLQSLTDNKHLTLFSWHYSYSYVMSLSLFLSVLVSQRSDAEDEDLSDREVQSVTMSLPDMSLLSTVSLSPSPTSSSSLVSDSLPSHDDLWARPPQPWTFRASELCVCITSQLKLLADLLEFFSIWRERRLENRLNKITGQMDEC